MTTYPLLRTNKNGMIAKRTMIEMMNMIEFSGMIYRTEYVTVCQSMTRIDTPIVVCFLLLLFAVRTTKNMCNYKY